jgi:hypothetical protein
LVNRNPLLSVQDESGVGKLLSPHKLNPDYRFESSTQESQRLGLHGKEDSSHRPATSAGYRTEDHGLLREQVYSAVRQLDSGRISTKVFRERLFALGISVPISVEKLIQVYDCNGRADFGKFIRAFEDFFASHPVLSRPGTTATEDASSPSGPGSRLSAITREQMLARDGYAGPVRPSNPYEASQDQTTFAEGNTSGGTFYSTHVDGLQRGHGDILGWSTPATSTEVEAPTGEEQTHMKRWHSAAWCFPFDANIAPLISFRLQVEKYPTDACMTHILQHSTS